MDKFCSSQEDDKPRIDNESGNDTTDTDKTDIDSSDTEDSYASAVEEIPESNFTQKKSTVYIDLTQEESIVDENVILSGK